VSVCPFSFSFYFVKLYSISRYTTYVTKFISFFLLKSTSVDVEWRSISFTVNPHYSCFLCIHSHVEFFNYLQAIYLIFPVNEQIKPHYYMHAIAKSTQEHNQYSFIKLVFGFRDTVPRPETHRGSCPGARGTLIPQLMSPLLSL